jgi:Domain of unknown function (DUF3841)
MIVQTFQPISVYEEAMDCGIVYAKQAPQDSCFDLAYSWMKDQMIKRNFLPSEDEKDLFWCWCWSGDLGKKMVDLRTKRYQHEINNNFVLMTLKKSESEVLVSDFQLWHFAWDKLCENEKTNFYKNKPLTDKNLDILIKKSWELIFELKREKDFFIYKGLEHKVKKHLEIMKNPVITQGTFWNIKKEDILKVKKLGK